MRERAAELERYGLQVVVIAFARVEVVRGYLRRYGLPFEGLADPERAVYRRYGLGRGSVGRVWGPRVWWHYLRAVLRGERPRPIRGDTLQLGGDFLVGADGRLLLVHPGHDPTDRPTVQAILDALADAGGPARSGPTGATRADGGAAAEGREP